GESVDVDRMRAKPESGRIDAERLIIGRVCLANDQKSFRPRKNAAQQCLLDQPAWTGASVVEQMGVAAKERRHPILVKEMQRAKMGKPRPTRDLHQVGAPVHDTPCQRRVSQSEKMIRARA